ncbi:hypothetical protein D3C79_832850 [compost metagenome]
MIVRIQVDLDHGFMRPGIEYIEVADPIAAGHQTNIGRTDGDLMVDRTIDYLQHLFDRLFGTLQPGSIGLFDP